MRWSRTLILAIAATIALEGCGSNDPDQPALGSISIKAKGDVDADASPFPNAKMKKAR